MKCVGFPPIARLDAKILILGSLPGQESLRQNQYYAKRGNSFWTIMGKLFGAHPDLPYDKRVNCLVRNHIALWDVCASAYRVGSLDAKIEAFSIVENNIGSFIKKHQRIRLICFNGQSAYKIFQKRVAPTLKTTQLLIEKITLPSTSPAHASMNLTTKFAKWSAIIRHL